MMLLKKQVLARINSKVYYSNYLGLTKMMKRPLLITVKEYLKENKKLSDFRIVEKIGEGAFGKVYLAIHTENQKVS